MTDRRSLTALLAAPVLACSFGSSAAAQAAPTADAGRSIALGKCFSIIAYAQLVAENCLPAKMADSTVAVIFHALIEDLREESLRLAAMFLPGSAQRAALKGTIQVPRTGASDLDAVSRFIAARYVE